MRLPISLSLGDEWKNWHADDPDWESGESVKQGLKKERHKNLKHDEKRIGMPAEPADG